MVGCYDNKGSGDKEGFELTDSAKELDLKTHGKFLHLINVYVRKCVWHRIAEY